MADDVVIEDPIGEAGHQPGRQRDSRQGGGRRVLRRQHRPQSADRHLRGDVPVEFSDEIAYILVLRTRFPNGFTATVRGVFTYKVNDAGLITNLRGYWNMDAMQFAQEGDGN